MEFKVKVKEKHNSQRAVDVLVEEFGLSSQMQKKIRLYGNLWINDIPSRMIDQVQTGDLIVAHPSKNPNELIPAKTKPIPNVEILYEDDHLVIVNKPAGLVVHPTTSHPDNTLLDFLSEQTLHPVTRLDRETSGALIIAKHAHAHYRIVRNPIKRVYWAFTHGHWPTDIGVIEQPIMRYPNSIMVRIVAPKGRPAVTRYRVLKYCQDENFDWVEFTLETGRTHQIRVHSLFNAHPLLGDGLYGLANFCEFDSESKIRILETDPNLNYFSLNKNLPESKKIEQGYLKNVDLLKLSPQRIASEKQADFKKLINEKQLYFDQIIKRQALHSRLIGFTHPITNTYLELKAELPQDMTIILDTCEK